MHKGLCHEMFSSDQSFASEAHDGVNCNVINYEIIIVLISGDRTRLLRQGSHGRTQVNKENICNEGKTSAPRSSRRSASPLSSRTDGKKKSVKGAH